jgi:hypothetical protein
VPSPVEQDRLEIPRPGLGRVSAAAAAESATATATATAAATLGTLTSALGVGYRRKADGGRRDCAARKNSSETLH